jgi:hypothetical protein
VGNRQRRVGRTAQGSRARCRVGLSVYLDERRFGAKPNVMASTASHKRYLPRPIQINRLTNRARHISGRLLTRVNEVSGIRRRHHRARADKESARCGTPRAVLVPRCPAIELTAVHHFSKADARACTDKDSDWFVVYVFRGSSHHQASAIKISVSLFLCGLLNATGPETISKP